MKKTIMLCAGGTGGHLFPAQALAVELGARGYDVQLMTDKRSDAFGADFPASAVHVIDSATLGGRSPSAILRTVLKLSRGLWQSLRLLRREKPVAMVGFGGYPSFPPMLAARLCAVPSVLHEANAVMGRANRMLARGASGVATAFDLPLPQNLQHKAMVTGNPLRPNVRDVLGAPYDAPVPAGPFHLLVFGGSQGARVFSQVVPEALALLAPEERARLAVVQQARAEDLPSVEARYRELGVAAQLAPFFADLPAHIAASHLVICRSGAGTVCELAAIGRPALLVPFPGALDNDQGLNADVLVQAGGARKVPQAQFSAQALAGQLKEFLAQPQQLADAAAGAKSAGQLEAERKLADFAETLIAGQQRS
ncbi:undecaprenyldiphospho-muramoylpentapeptide beta-N-acetylglucosaminyltransferase [Polycladidibacter hongkongensis]|uniref:undecaprenyldiphospho-muramoylpentapeptide beta-N-acetylglucosaminyltransferase n=1 Tax=Polycladidibacter hongkongensis TaxID=1647556 RepID=UPI00082BB38B|nr:undecaprenyldiphospho-muramoylpentapeptide beta-N-acetylglucosaminyltransferase [Pseudovibrio hongkongensis]